MVVLLKLLKSVRSDDLIHLIAFKKKLNFYYVVSNSFKILLHFCYIVHFLFLSVKVSILQSHSWTEIRNITWLL